MSTPPTPVTPPPAGDPGLAAFHSTAALRASVDLASALHYSLNSLHAKGQAHLIRHNVQPYEALMVQLVLFDKAHLERLVLLADALQFVNSTLQGRADRVRALPHLAEAGWPLRKLMLKYLDVLVEKGLVDQKKVEELRAGQGYGDLADDLDTMANMLRALPQVLGSGSPVTNAEVDKATQIAHQISVEVAFDAVVELKHRELLAERTKLGHLLVESHREIRRAIEYIRYHEGDAATIVPPLHVPGGRGAPASKAPDPREELAALHDSLHEHEHEPAIDPELNPFIDA